MTRESHARLIGPPSLHVSPHADGPLQENSQNKVEGASGSYSLPSIQEYASGDAAAIRNTDINTLKANPHGDGVAVVENHKTHDLNLGAEIQYALAELDHLRRSDLESFLKQNNRRENLLLELCQFYNSREEEHRSAKRRLEHEMEEMVHDRNHLQECVRMLQDDIRNLKKHLEEKRAPVPQGPVSSSKTASAGCYAAHTADSASGADIIHDTKLLNNDIFQFAAGLAEHYSDGARDPAKKLSANDVQRFGLAIANFIFQAKARAEHPWIVHAIQACTVTCCTNVLTSWIPFSKQGGLLKDIHRNIRAAEGQGVSGQWRSLIYRHGVKNLTEEELFDYMRRELQFTWTALEWSKTRSVHQEALGAIVSRVLRLYRMVRIDVVSSEIAIISPAPGDLFDPETMEVSDSKDMFAMSLYQQVLCTTDMGLKKRVMERLYSESERKWMVHEHETTILKAKVALQGKTENIENRQGR